MSRGKAPATLALEVAIVEIVEERRPITVRGIAYALFVRGLIGSMALGETRKVSRIATDMRETGALLGGLLIGMSEAIAGALIAPSAKSMVSFGLLIVVLLARPQGLLGTART